MSDLPVPEATRLLSKLEHNPHLITAYWWTLEGLTAACMKHVYGGRDTHDKMALTAIEYRARLPQERVKGCPN